MRQDNKSLALVTIVYLLAVYHAVNNYFELILFIASGLKFQVFF